MTFIQGSTDQTRPVLEPEKTVHGTWIPALIKIIIAIEFFEGRRRISEIEKKNELNIEDTNDTNPNVALKPINERI